jgi:photosystem II stability/assembly factor-like uncharacterized protein
VLFSSKVGTRGWAPVEIPSHGDGLSIAAAGNVVTLLQDHQRGSDSGSSPGRLWVSIDQGASWDQRDLPCGEGASAAALSVAPDQPDSFLLDCFDGEESSQAQRTHHYIYGSSDGGRQWMRRADAAGFGVPASLTDNGAGHAFLALESGGADALVVSTDGGMRWHTAIRNDDGFFGWGDLHFVNRTTGFILGPTHNAEAKLYETTDGGSRWDLVALP